MDEFFDDEEETDHFASVLTPFLLLAFKKGIQQAKNQGSGSATVEDVLTPAVQIALKKKSTDHAALSVGTTKDEMESILAKARQEGLTVSQFAKQIDDSFKLFSRPRSLRIARTEMTDTINQGTTATLDAEGHSEKEWSTVIDGNERDTHAAADGQTVGINETFKVGGASCMYPGDDMLPPEERINCRCTVLGAGLHSDRIATLGQQFLRIHGQLENRLVVNLRREFDKQRRRILSHFPN